MTKDDIRKEIIAFANTNGGTIYIGIKDDGEIVGVDSIDSVLAIHVQRGISRP